jgi:hypothetical protein
MWWHTATHGWGSEGETGEWSGYPVLLTLPRNMVYPALLPLMRTRRLPVVDWTDPPSPRTFKWTRPFRLKTKSGFCACAITFQTQSTVLFNPQSNRPFLMFTDEKLSYLSFVNFWPLKFQGRTLRASHLTSDGESRLAEETKQTPSPYYVTHTADPLASSATFCYRPYTTKWLVSAVCCHLKVRLSELYKTKRQIHKRRSSVGHLSAMVKCKSIE